MDAAPFVSLLTGFRNGSPAVHRVPPLPLPRKVQSLLSSLYLEETRVPFYYFQRETSRENADDGCVGNDPFDRVVLAMQTTTGREMTFGRTFASAGRIHVPTR